MILQKECWFEAAHRLHNTGGPCDRLHGHSYRVEFVLYGTPNPKNGMIVDFSRVAEIVKCLDHKYLNDLPPFKGIPTTAENIALFLAASVRNLGLRQGKVTVWETRNNAATANL